MLATALFMTSCRNSRQMLSQMQTERVNDTVRELVLVTDTVREQVIVYDTLRETTTIQLNADGDTVSRTTEREHISDRTRDHAKATQQMTATESVHQEASTDNKKETVEVEPKVKSRWSAFWWGYGVGSVTSLAVGLIGVFYILRKYKI